MSARTAVARPLLAGLLVFFLVAGALGGLLAATAQADSAPLAPTDPGTPTTVAADALPTVQINGVAWSQVIVGDIVYVAGEFTSARPAGVPAGTQETPRSHLLAYDIRTGELITSFAPVLNAQALALAASPDGSRLYVGGDFTEADGQPRKRFAAYSTATGQLIGDVRPSFSSQVRAIAATDSTVYVGGTFLSVGSIGRTRLAAVSAVDGSLLPWAPQPGVGSTDGNDDGNRNTDNSVMALVITGGGSQVVAGGRFDSLNDIKSTGVGALDPITGETRPFAIGRLITNQGVNSAVFSLSTDGSTVYGTGYDFFGPGNLEGSFAVSADAGAVQWINDCHGDTYSSFPMNGALYMATHAHVCSNIGGFPEMDPRVNKFATAVSLVATGEVGNATLANGNFRGQPAPSLLPWFPTMTPGTYTQQFQAGWHVTGNGEYLVYGGEFPRVNGADQQGLVRYAMPSIAPNRVGPVAADLNPTVSSPVGGMARIGWQTTSDRDNEYLTYRVYRDGNSTTPVHEVTQSSLWWTPQAMGFVDTAVTAGTHTYQVSAFDAFGNRANSPWVSVEVATGTIPQRDYSDAVRADGARHYWPLGEASGSTVHDYAGAGDLAIRPGWEGATPDQGAAGAIVGDPDTAYEFLGMVGSSSRGYLSTQSAVAGPHTFTVEAWFATTSTAGGKIIGFGDEATGNSNNYDRHVFMDTAGRLQFGVHPGTGRVVAGADAYNDGQWHHVAASLSETGMALYVDGALVDSRSDTTSAQDFTGYWRVGGDSSWSGAAYFDGTIDEVAVYPTALSSDRIANHHSLGATGNAINLAPSAAYTTTVRDLTASFDANGSADDDGTIASYEWTFGDGSTGKGATASHTYAAAGTYPVTLTVTDDDGATGDRSATVTVTDPPPNVDPTAAFSAVASGLSVSVDGSASADPDGGVVSYAWDFGDGATGAGATASHVYAAAGTYAVTLTVTDEEGATGTAEQSVTVGETVAADAFERAVGAGFGAADVGGDWAVSSSARTSVSGGAGHVQVPAGSRTWVALESVEAGDVALQMELSMAEAPTGGGAYVSLQARRVGSTDYRVVVRVAGDGQVYLSPMRVVDGAQAPLANVLVPGLTFTPGGPLVVRVEVGGQETATLRAKAWALGSTEPSAWQVEETDTSAELQRPGGVGISTYVSGSATAPVQLDVDNFWVGPPGQTPPADGGSGGGDPGDGAPGGNEPGPGDPDQVNSAPTATFAAQMTGSTVTVDGSASADPDGTVVSYAWDFGDGATGTGATASHTYAAAGTYPVTLTVTDEEGATGTTEQSVTVAEATDPVVLAADVFERTVTGGWGSADEGGIWTSAFGAGRQSVVPGAGTFTLAPATQSGTYLGEVSETDVDVLTTVLVADTPTGGGVNVLITGRRVDADQEYRLRLRFLADGRVLAGLTRLSGTAADVSIVPDVVLPGQAYVPGTPLRVRLSVTGTGTTDLAAKIWTAGDEEPAGWTVTGADSTASLQGPGSIGMMAYLSGSATVQPLTVRFSEFEIRRPD